MRILHLGYEDPAQPGSGGGSLRTHEINRRLSDRHDITIVVAGYPGARRRLEDGIHWEPLWPRTGTALDRLAYFALLCFAIQRFPHDLLVEDFGAPFSTGMSPWFTRKPVIASVQWLFATQMRQKYHLPFDYVEHKGLQHYQNFIAVSDWLSSEIQQRHPNPKNVNITTVPNGVDSEAFSVERATPQHFLFVGRMDIQQKGCDLLIQITERAHRLLDDLMPPLLIIGNGPDQPMLERQVQKAGLNNIIRFCGRIEGRRKYELMAQAFAVLMPSRFETFGIVAAESQASGAPLIAFDVGPLKEVTGGRGTSLISPFDLDAFAQEMAKAVVDRKKMSSLGKQARQWARQYDWDLIARRQEAVYLEVVKASASRTWSAFQKKPIGTRERLHE
jgi:glycosyltransferase involved in cell wall biosynthesis